MMLKQYSCRFPYQTCPSLPRLLHNMQTSLFTPQLNCFFEPVQNPIKKMYLRIFLCYNLFITQVYLIQTLNKTNAPRKSSLLIVSSTTNESDCLETLITETFRYTERSLISITVTETEMAAYDLQSEIIRYLNQKGNISLQLLGDPPHPEFKSSTICFKEHDEMGEETCRNNFVVKESTDFYLIIAQDTWELHRSLYSAYNSTSFNPSATVLLFWRHLGNISTYDLLPVLWKYQMLRVVLVDHDLTSDSLTVHVLQLKLSGPGLCLEKSKFTTAGSCSSLKQPLRLKSLIRSRTPKYFKNCTIEAVAMQYEPYVINEEEGVEVALLKQLGKYNNVTFDIQLTAESMDWGDKVNGTWNGNFAQIINTLKIGIGNVGPEADRLEDFDFTFSYKSPVLVWVVPIAENVKKWRVLTIIFTPQLWGVVFGVFFLTSGLFMWFSRVFKDDPFLQSVSGSFLASLQVIISSSVHHPPKTNLVRLVFTAGLLFALIVTCVYSSSLINVLTKVVKEHQIQNERDIVDSGLIIGGLEEYLERFQKSDNNDCLDDICKKYQFFRGEKDTATFWLKKVRNREACTPLSRQFVQYDMVKRFEMDENKTESLYERRKRIKMFIINKPINFYSLAIVMTKGNPFKISFDKFLKKFVEAGLIYTVNVKYKDKFKRLTNLVHRTDEGPERLSIYHVQGPFAILGIGDCIALLVFLIEKLRTIFHPVLAKKKSKSKVVRRDPRVIFQCTGSSYF